MTEDHRAHCTHCAAAQKPAEPYFWLHHGNPGPIPGYCVDCAVTVMRAAAAFVKVQEPLASGGFAADVFDALRAALAPRTA